MECMLQWLDELEDLVYCLPMLWARIRTWLLLVLSVMLAAMALFSTPVVTVAPVPALLALLLLVSVTLVAALRMAARRPRIREFAASGLADRA